jgi:hypothetical protein
MRSNNRNIKKDSYVAVAVATAVTDKGERSEYILTEQIVSDDTPVATSAPYSFLSDSTHPALHQLPTNELPPETTPAFLTAQGVLQVPETMTCLELSNGDIIITRRFWHTEPLLVFALVVFLLLLLIIDSASGLRVLNSPAEWKAVLFILLPLHLVWTYFCLSVVFNSTVITITPTECSVASKPIPFPSWGGIPNFCALNETVTETRCKCDWYRYDELYLYEVHVVRGERSETVVKFEDAEPALFVRQEIDRMLSRPKDGNAEAELELV